MHRQHIQVSLNEIAFVLADDLALREIDSIQCRALVIDLRLRRIDILSDVGSLVVRAQSPAAESQHAAAHRMDRENHAVVELVAQRAVVTLYADTGRGKEFLLVAL